MSREDSIDVLDWVGMLVDEEGSVQQAGMKVAGVGEYVWSPTRFEDALADTISEPRIELLVINGDRYLKRILELDQGPEHMVLVRDESRPDRLVEIAAPLVRLE